MRREEMILKIIDDITYLLKKMEENKQYIYTYRNMERLNGHWYDSKKVGLDRANDNKKSHIDYMMKERGILNCNYISKILAIAVYSQLIDGCLFGCRGVFELTNQSCEFLFQNSDKTFFIETINIYINRLIKITGIKDVDKLFNYEIDCDIFYKEGISADADEENNKEEFLLQCNLNCIVTCRPYLKTEDNEDLYNYINQFCFEHKLKSTDLSVSDKAEILTYIKYKNYIGLDFVKKTLVKYE